MTVFELLQSLNELDEHERVEAKRASEVGKSLLETVCAFANEPSLGGGWILLGAVRDELSLFPSYTLEGIEQPDKLVADLATQCRNTFNVPVRVEIATESYEGKVAVRVFVPEAQPQEKPVFFKAQGLPKGAFRRVGSIDQRCTEDDLALFYQNHQSESFDTTLVPDTELEDLSPEAVEDYRKSRAKSNPDAEELRWDDSELLQSLGCLRRDPTGKWKPTVAGVVLFGKPATLRRCFPTLRVDYIRIPGRDWVPDPDRRFDTIELRDPLFRLIRRAQASILDDLPKSFGMDEGGLQRRDTPLVPLRVIREAVVNAVMHRSYRSPAPIQILRYTNRLEIHNPGFSLKSPDHLGDPGSLPRNPRIAEVLHETLFAETKGSGIRVMRDGMEQAGLTPPRFVSDRSADQFVATYLFHHFLGPDDLLWLAQFREHKLSDEEARALVVIREAGSLDNAGYRELNKVDTLAASQALRRLRNAGLLTQKGRGSATYYVPTERLLHKPDDGEGLSANPPGLSDSLGALSSNPQGLSSNLGALSSNPPALPSNPLGEQVETPTRFDETRRCALLDDLPGSLAARIGAIGQRHPPQEIRNLVCELCAQRAWSVDDLSQVLRRNPEVVRQTYLRPLMREGRLTMTRPDEPNSPDQAYRAVEGEG